MNLDFSKLKLFLFYMLIIIIIFLSLILFNTQHQNTKFDNEVCYKLNTDWFYTNANGETIFINLPSKIEDEPNKTLVVKRKLPEILDSTNTLCLRTSRQNLNVYIEDRLIYSYGDNNKNNLSKTSNTSVWNIVRLPQNSENKTITLELTSAYNYYTQTVPEVYSGTKAAILFYLLKSYGLRFLLSIFILFTGIFLSSIYIIYRKLLNSNKSVLYLGLFSILISIWMICESKMTQFFIGNQVLTFFIAFSSVLIAPISLLLYIQNIESYSFKKTLSASIYLLCINAYIMIISQIFSLIDFYTQFMFSSLFLFLVSFSIIFTLFIEAFKYKNKEITSIILPILILFFGFTIELIYFYEYASVSRGTFIQIGVFIFIISLSYRAVKKSVLIIKRSRDSKYYEIMATRDSMTNCKNRTAFNNELKNITLDQAIAIIMVDVNNLKQINDTYGHHIGDDAIIKCSKCLEKISTDRMRFYRIGGDEFVWIECIHNNHMIEFQIEKFINECYKENLNCFYEFQVAIGYAIYDKSVDADIHDTLKRADKNMYETKIKMKAQSSSKNTQLV